MPKNLSAKYCEENNKKNDNIIVSITRISQKMKNKSLSSIEKSKE